MKYIVEYTRDLGHETLRVAELIGNRMRIIHGPTCMPGWEFYTWLEADTDEQAMREFARVCYGIGRT